MTYKFVKSTPIDRDKIRERLQGMSNKDLREFGKACEHGCSEKGAPGEPPGKDFMIQLELAREEWKRRMK